MADDYRPGQSDIEPVRCEGEARIIDFRSPFTAMHSAGVAASARELARLAGMTDEECRMMEIAGFLHDVGKLHVPNEIGSEKITKHVCRANLTLSFTALTALTALTDLNRFFTGENAF